jgi:WD40 repeat protein
MHRLRLAAVLQKCPKLVQVLPHDGPVNVAEFSRDGRRVVTASADGTARIWDVETGRQLASLSHNNSPVSNPSVRHASFSPGGRYVVTAATDKTAAVWNTANGEQVCTVQHEDQVRRAAFSSNGRYIVTGSADRTARVWDSRTGNPVSKKPMSHAGFVYFVAFSPNGKLVVTACDDENKTVGVWDVKTAERVMEALPNSDDVLSAAFSRNGDRIVTAAKDGTVNIVEVPGRRNLRRLSLGPAEFADDSKAHVSFADDNGSLVLTVGASGPHLWEVGTGIKLRHPAKEYWGNNPSFSPDGRLRLSWSSREYCARILDETSEKFKVE